ncbi:MULTISPECIES: YhcN/YlaJ family sporulation lipoprotein [Peribacillus]|uniref:YhcN/YlaJ family sporulation lipoprotein n=1 Tax=Peribacillus TaxID=2675229 RepID=UPI001911CDC1|nr:MULTISPECIES: YhcN/YlaJ family sporulation lipoprotein [unclassified Peribacillus]MBK5444634.1 YhcN/YlaJ family sporulation lipoprotein [Peribacillus sp. TH24]MBK5460660.1 YhcN/YlaJ family sporulation lipoprotein [Peribacillus sp. TH27]MBK5482444.1 YhcN/YlaJ family sporulation lipoprotein [Peribacillus sp. TH16]MBK5498808.1 YhcN/YlaJ family sporulation lipoprotein [Peribacillus sp. TH14]WMX56085.1 YhcN/YlaJ family sporulation lipoprotein [Peribacillus sp. R9-11]
MKYKMKTLKTFLFLITVIGFVSGCSGNSNQIDNNKNLNISKVHTSSPIKQSVANQAKDRLLAEEEVSDVKAVNSDKELLVAVKVDNFDRFRLKSVKKQAQSDLENMFPDYKILISTDQKMFLELDQLEQKLEKDKTKMDSLKKDFKEIKSLMKEQT